MLMVSTLGRVRNVEVAFCGMWRDSRPSDILRPWQTTVAEVFLLGCESCQRPRPVETNQSVEKACFGIALSRPRLPSHESVPIVSQEFPAKGHVVNGTEVDIPRPWTLGLHDMSLV